MLFSIVLWVLPSPVLQVPLTLPAVIFGFSLSLVPCMDRSLVLQIVPVLYSSLDYHCAL